MSGTLFVVATPIGNLEDITTRALRVLREVSVIAAEDTRRTAHLLARYAITTPTTSLHEHNEHKKAPELVERLQRGDHVALVTDAGTPAVSDPGRTLVQLAVAADVRIEPVPGPNAAIAAIAVSGFPSDAFRFMGFPPTRSTERRAWFGQLQSSVGTVVFFEAPHRIQSTLGEIQSVIGDQEVLVARELTKAHEELVRGPISTVLARLKPKGEFTVVIKIGLKTKSETNGSFSEAGVVAEFGLLTESGGFSRRQAISTIAKRYGISSKVVYAALEEAKRKSGD